MSLVLWDALFGYGAKYARWKIEQKKAAQATGENPA